MSAPGLTSNRTSASSLQQIEHGQFSPQPLRVDELDAVNAKALGGVYLLRDLVDEYPAVRVGASRFDQDFVDAPIRLDRLDLARNDDAVEQPQEIETLTRQRV